MPPAPLTSASKQNAPRPRPFTVSEVMGQIRACLEDGFRPLVVKGEVRDARQPRSGHVYLTLCDRNARLRVVVFSSTLKRSAHRIEDGAELLVWGRIGAYERSGDVQLIAERFEPAGLGAHWVRREELRKALQAEGLFAPERKRPLPRIPASVGVITSPTGSAIHDVVTTLGRRFPGLRIVITPVRVNGAVAAPEIADAISRLDTQGDVEVILLVRGGGSAEDLACFDDEAVVRAVARASTPVIAGVGHEDDVTLADLVADRRAPTPTGAAELAVPVRADLSAALDRRAERLTALMTARLQAARRDVQRAAGSHALRVPTLLLAALRARTDDAARRLELRRPDAVIARQREHVATAERRLARAMEQRLAHAAQGMASRAARLEALSPLRVLARGFSLTTTEDGELVHRAEDLAPGDVVRTRLAEGAIRAQVLDVEPVPPTGT